MDLLTRKCEINSYFLAVSTSTGVWEINMSVKSPTFQAAAEWKDEGFGTESFVTTMSFLGAVTSWRYIMLTNTRAVS